MSLQKQNGYFAAGLAALVGAVALRSLGMYLGTSYVKKFMPNAELESLIPLAIFHFVGWWVGEVLGCWLGLRWRHHRRAGETATLRIGLTPFAIVFWLIFYPVFLNWVRASVSELEFAQLYEKLSLITVSFLSIALALLARFLTKPLAA